MDGPDDPEDAVDVDGDTGVAGVAGVAGVTDAAGAARVAAAGLGLGPAPALAAALSRLAARARAKRLSDFLCDLGVGLETEEAGSAAGGAAADCSSCSASRGLVKELSIVGTPGVHRTYLPVELDPYQVAYCVGPYLRAQPHKALHSIPEPILSTS